MLARDNLLPRIFSAWRILSSSRYRSEKRGVRIFERRDRSSHISKGSHVGNHSTREWTNRKQISN